MKQTFQKSPNNTYSKCPPFSLRLSNATDFLFQVTFLDVQIVMRNQDGDDSSDLHKRYEHF